MDVLLILEVYSAGESSIVGADSRALCRAIRARNQVEPIHVSCVEALPSLLSQLLKPDDILFAQGAGSISAIAHQLLEEFKDTSLE